MLKRTVRRAWPHVFRAIFFVVLFFIGRGAVLVLEAGVGLWTADELVFSVTALAFGFSVVGLFYAMVVRGSEVFAGWDRDLAKEDREHCARPLCDRRLVKPYFRQDEYFICPECVRADVRPVDRRQSARRAQA